MRCRRDAFAVAVVLMPRMALPSGCALPLLLYSRRALALAQSHALPMLLSIALLAVMPLGASIGNAYADMPRGAAIGNAYA